MSAACTLHPTQTVNMESKSSLLGEYPLSVTLVNWSTNVSTVETQKVISYQSHTETRYHDVEVMLQKMGIPRWRR
jgi:hypothetical protein